MSRLDDLIAELCPDGVPYRPLGEVLSYEQPTKYLVQSAAYSDAFKMPVLTAGQTFILGYTDEAEGALECSPDQPVVIFDDFTTAHQWVDFAFKAKSSAMKILRPRNGSAATLRYAFFTMQSMRFVPSQHERHWISKYSLLRIPVPPLEVQGEIVRILDLFTALEAELEAELEARRQQFVSFRERALDFEGRDDVAWLPMAELGVFTRGRRFTKEDRVAEGIPSIHYGEIYTDYGTTATRATSHVRVEMAQQLRYAPPGAVIFAGVGETVDDVAKAVAWRGTDPVAIHDDCFAFVHTLNPDYVAFAVQTRRWNEAKAPYVSRAKMKRVSAESLGRLRIPVPSREEQASIVERLTAFDALVNDISVGLPAELEARRKQYAYYRDKLLTFKELAA